jgi:hypothetical protein
VDCGFRVEVQKQEQHFKEAAYKPSQRHPAKNDWKFLRNFKNFTDTVAFLGSWGLPCPGSPESRAFSLRLGSVTQVT